MSDYQRASGSDLDRIAIVLGAKRKRWFWIFRERDKTLRARLTEMMRAPWAKV